MDAAFLDVFSFPLLAILIACLGLFALAGGLCVPQLSWTSFLLAGLAALAVAFLTVSYEALRVAATNPAACLRYE